MFALGLADERNAGHIRIYDTRMNKTVVPYIPTHFVTALKYRKDKHELLVGFRNGTISLMKEDSRNMTLAHGPGPDNFISCLEWADKYPVTCDKSGCCITWNRDFLDTLEPGSTVPISTDTV